MLLLQPTNLQGSIQQMHQPLSFCFSGKTTHHPQKPTSQICTPDICQFWIPQLLVSQLPVKLGKIKLTENSMFLSETAAILFYDGLHAKFHKQPLSEGLQQKTYL